jgi:hypothetical protein
VEGGATPIISIITTTNTTTMIPTLMIIIVVHVPPGLPLPRRCFSGRGSGPRTLARRSTATTRGGASNSSSPTAAGRTAGSRWVMQNAFISQL